MKVAGDAFLGRPDSRTRFKNAFKEIPPPNQPLVGVPWYKGKLYAGID